MAEPSRFSEKLAAYDPARLREAFDACGDYNRTTLNRWLEGALPQRGEFIERLAQAMDDPSLYEAWKQAKQGGPAASANAVVKAFERLSDDDKDRTFHEIRGLYLGTYPSARSRMAYRVEVNDPLDDSDDHLRIAVTMTWVGPVAANAYVQIVTGHEELGDAYADPTCIFREIVDLEPERLHQLLAGDRSPILAINPLDRTAPRGAHHVAREVEPGRFQFDNSDAADAQVRLSLTYPFPRGRPVYPIKIGRFQVDTFDVTLALNSGAASMPQAFPFLPPGRQREWSQSYLPPDELFVTVGIGNTEYGEGDGLVLSWRESPSDREHAGP